MNNESKNLGQMSPEWMQTVHEAEITKKDEKIEQLERKVAELEELAYKDKLTGLLNRNGLEKELSEKHYGRPDDNNEVDPIVCLLVLDIDHFKQINDKFGHPVGDIVLAEVGNKLKEKFRTGDLIARWGGEEIVLVVEGHDEKDILSKHFTIDNTKKDIPVIHSRFNLEIPIEGQNVTVTLSGGVTRFNIYSESFTEAFKRADEILYVAKGKNDKTGKGRNRILTGEQAKELTAV